MCSSATKPHPTRPTLTVAMALSLHRNPSYCLVLRKHHPERLAKFGIVHLNDVCKPVWFDSIALQQATLVMEKSAPRPESLLAALPAELSQSLFAKARPLSLKAEQTLFVAGDEGDEIGRASCREGSERR